MKKKIIHGTSDTWSMIHLSHRPSDLAYYIVNWRILNVHFSGWRKISFKVEKNSFINKENCIIIIKLENQISFLIKLKKIMNDPKHTALCVWCSPESTNCPSATKISERKTQGAGRPLSYPRPGGKFEDRVDLSTIIFGRHINPIPVGRWGGDWLCPQQRRIPIWFVNVLPALSPGRIQKSPGIWRLTPSKVHEKKQHFVFYVLLSLTLGLILPQNQGG